MRYEVSGKQIDVGEALQSHVKQELAVVMEKYSQRPTDATVIFSRSGHEYVCEATVHLSSGLNASAKAHANEIYAAFDAAGEKMDKQLRRYKRRLKDHHAGPKGLSPEKQEMAAAEVARMTVFRNLDDADDDSFGDVGKPDGEAPAGLVIAETESELRTLTVGQAVLELDMTGYPVVVFKNAAHGGVAVVYRRPDGNIGWVDPRRTSSQNGHGSVNGSAV